MQSQKAQKIDLSIEYPCPNCRRGQIIPITLTEAFGCDRCQQIFVAEDNGYALEQLATIYPYKRIWRWTGNRWIISRPRFSGTYLPIAVVIILVLLLVWLPLALQSAQASHILIWAMAAVLLAILPAVMHLLTYRR